jgi:hypothetical protein
MFQRINLDNLSKLMSKFNIDIMSMFVSKLFIRDIYFISCLDNSQSILFLLQLGQHVQVHVQVLKFIRLISLYTCNVEN